MVIQRHTIKMGIDVLVLVPPSEEVLVLDIFGAGTQVLCDFVAGNVSRK